MKETKLKFIFLQLLWIIYFTRYCQCVSKCNLPMLRKFTLTGMKYSVYDKMKICGHVHDKCCTVADEIKLTKLWQQRTGVMLEQNIDMSMLYMKKLTEQFEDLAKLDPRLLAIKYVIQREVPYVEQYCTFKEKSAPVHNHLDALRIYEQSVRNSMRRLVDKVYPDQSQGRNLKQLYNDQRYSQNNNVLEDTELKVLAENQEVQKGQRLLYQGQNLLSSHRISQLQGVNIDYLESKCNIRKNKFYKDFIIVNKFKSDQCMNLLDKAFDFNNRKFQGYLGKVKAGLFKVMRYKANFYCALCDAHSQKFFNISKKQFIFSENFCQNILIKNEAHIKFINIVLVEYIDFLIRIMTCYSTNGRVKDLRVVNFLQKYKRRVPLIQRCYQSLSNGDEFFKNCWFLCHSYKVMETSPFYEGDVKLYKTVYLALYSFLRKFKSGHKQDSEDDDGNVDGLLTEPLSAPFTVSTKFAFDRKTRKQILGHTIVAKKLSKYKIAKLKSFFTKHGLKGFKTFVNGYQKLFPEKKIFQKPTTKIQKKYFKQIKRMYMKKVSEIKYNLRTNSHMDPKVLRMFKKLFKKTFMNYSAVESITPEYMPLRKLKGFKGRVLQSRSNDTIRQASLIKNKIRRIQLQSRKSKNKVRYLKQKDDINLKEKKKPVIKKEKDERRIPVEPGSQIYQASISMFDLSDFYLEYKVDGMDISKFTNLIDFEMDATTLISQKLDKQPKVNLSVVNAYLALRPKQINQFNHMWSELITPAIEMKQLTSDYTKKRVEKMQAQKELNYPKTIKIQSQINDIQAKAKKVLKAQQDKQDLIAYKKKMKDLKLEKKQKEKVVLNHHIDQPKFEKNFSGIKDLFLKLFGT